MLAIAEIWFGFWLKKEKVNTCLSACKKEANKWKIFKFLHNKHVAYEM